MKDDIIVALNTLEIDLLINILDEVVSSQKILKVITKEIRQELSVKLNVAKVLTNLKEKLGEEKFEQLEDSTREEQNKVRTYAIKFSDDDIDYLRQGNYNEVEMVIENILKQIK